MKTLPKEHIFQNLLSESGVRKVHSLFNNHITSGKEHIRTLTGTINELIQTFARTIHELTLCQLCIDVRKLSGRLLCEACYRCQANQDYICGLHDLEPLNGVVSINQTLPKLIKQRLKDDPDFLYSLHMN